MLPIDALTTHGIKPSVQRIAVMEYLMEHHTHPNADEIHSALVKRMPTLSKTTVYNTLRLLVEHGAVQQLTIDEHNVNFDGDTTPHAHFLCRQCGKVYDLALRNSRLERAAIVPKDFQLEHSALYFHGLCRECQEISN